MRSNRGKGWEARLDAQHVLYRRDRRAIIHKTYPPTKLVRGKLVHTAKAPVDYLGVIDGGRAVAFDAKDGRGNSWPFDKLKRHQALGLGAWTDRGALAGIALRLPAGQWFVPWLTLGPVWWAWQEKEEGARASVDAPWLNANAWALEGADWLSAYWAQGGEPPPGRF